MAEPIYVDSNAFIDPVPGEDSPRGRGPLRLLSSIENERAKAYTSALKWDEVCWVITKVMGDADRVSAAQKLLTSLLAIR